MNKSSRILASSNFIRIGKAWEGYIAGVMRNNHWDHVVENVVLRRNGQALTDVDLVAKRGDTLYIIQIKVYYGNGISQFEQWKFRQKLEHGVEQVKLSADAIASDSNVLKAYFTSTQLAEIQRTQPLVMTNTHYYNGWWCRDVPVMSTGALMQIINGATDRFVDIDGKVLDTKRYAAGDVLTNDEIFDFLETPLDWRIGDTAQALHHHRETFDHAVLKFPYFIVQ
ncbi:hypothetical protein LLH06_20725 [Mucilaginibacter daejeonensis]|uniref:hypothetical protein n=1 Tax=Mucilaginibacter daejeonensis TaxID=398049 RepID=UPI001D177A07|nr:hypothetical protein [Mucilaginibacter daejeonensis]UEG53363.1 hypothetical protein LLH06_20725 [Mucilaginibacter daejeonensis]